MKKLFDNENVTIITYLAEFGGSAIRRIILSDNSYFSEYGKESITYPPQIEGFLVYRNHFLSFKEQHLACAHTEDVPLNLLFEPPDRYKKVLEPNFNSLNFRFLRQQLSHINSGKKICVRTHEFDHEKYFKKAKIIRLYGKSLDRFNKAARFSKPTNSFYNKDFIPPSTESHVLNIRTDKLFSKSFDDFLEQYLNMTDYLNISPKINSTRQFILMWLEKQERFKKDLS